MKYRESIDLELKEKCIDSFLKMVSAFSNICNGKNYFWCDNMGNYVGI